MKKLLSALLVSAMLFAVTACDSTSTSSSTAPAPSSSSAAPSSSSVASSSSESTAPTESAESPEIAALREEFLAKANEVIVNEDSVTFTDGSGREPITIAKNPTNVAGLYGSYTALWYEAGGEVKGAMGGSAVDTYIQQIGRDITLDEGVTVLAESSSGKNWSVEEIIASQPDLIYCSTAMSGYATIGPAAEAANIPIIAISYDDFSDYLKWFKVIANIYDKPELFEDVAMKNLEEVLNVIEQVPEGDAPQVLAMFSEDSVNLSGTLMGQMLVQLGGENVADKLNSDVEITRLDVSLENIFELNPEIIIVQTHGDDLPGIFDEMYGTQPLWAEIDAVKNEQVHFMTEELFHIKPNKRFSEAYYELASVLYPEHTFSLEG